MPHDRADDAPRAADSLAGAPGRAFSQPWQARAFALAVLAARQGSFSWSEWSQALSRELRGAPDDAYFECWLSALQSLLIGKGAVARGELLERKHAWEDAYRTTPHGAPVSLQSKARE